MSRSPLAGLLLLLLSPAALVGAVTTAPAAEAATSAPTAAAAAETTTAATVAPDTSAALHQAAVFSDPPDVGTIEEPVSGLPADLSQYGYVEQEYFASGTAHAYRATSAPSDGKWTVVPTSAASYATRILVRRPADPARFDGTVAVEWLNESAGESDPDWDYLNPELMQSGTVWVGVSAQALGVEGGTPLLGSIEGSGTGLVHEEPQRYGSLHHPGDQYALDIYNQIGLGLRAAADHRSGSGVDPLGPLHPRHVVAVGESQSAFYLTTYADALEPVSRAFDGIFIHSRGGSGAPLSGSSITSNLGSQVLRIRTDLGVPVFMFETQTDLVLLDYAPAQQPNTRYIRTWEVAGTSHADEYLLGSNSVAGLLGCTSPINTGPQHVVVQAAFASFLRWVAHGTPPPSPPPFSLRSVRPPVLSLDRYGNVVGGVRTPAVDVPVSTLSGAGPPHASTICALFGSTSAFSPHMLTIIYGSKAAYLSRFSADLDRAVGAGYVLPQDRAALLAQAQEVRFS